MLEQPLEAGDLPSTCPRGPGEGHTGARLTMWQDHKSLGKVDGQRLGGRAPQREGASLGTPNRRLAPGWRWQGPGQVAVSSAPHGV